MALAPVASQATRRTGPPLVVTGGVSHVRSTSAELDGAVSPHGLATTYYFVYGPTPALGSQTAPQTLPASEERVKVGQTASPFAAGYYYRLIAYNAAGYSLRAAQTRKYEHGATLKFDVAKTLAPIVYRHGFELTGRLVGADAAHVSVALQESPYPFLSAFADVGATLTTGPEGEFTFRVASMSQSAKFRVAALLPRPVYSAILTLNVTPRVVLRVRKSATKGLVRLYGTIAPAQNGARVSIQLSQPARPGATERTSERTSKYVTAFTTVARKATQSVSRFSIIVSVKHAGHYRAYVQLSRAPLSSGASNVVTLAARAKR